MDWIWINSTCISDDYERHAKEFIQFAYIMKDMQKNLFSLHNVMSVVTTK